MTINAITIMLIVVGIMLAGSAIYVYVKNRTLEQIRGDVYQLFLEAEHRYKESGTGKKKMEWVIKRARMLLPEWARVIITEDLMIEVIEGWFKAVKDLLDDGKYNHSVKDEE